MPLAEKNLRKAVGSLGTLPKGQRIEAFLDSMRNVDELVTNGDSVFHDHGSDDSLDAIPSVSLSAPHTSRDGNPINEPSNELLQQLKQRLKKTTSENFTQEDAIRPQRPEPKPRKVDDGSQTDTKTTGWGKKKTNLSTATIKSTQSLSPKSKL
jgi:hypothetical protein